MAYTTYVLPEYFKHELISIPNYNDLKVAERINKGVYYWEKEFYLKVFGYEFTNLFMTALEDVEVADERFTKILNGVEFTDASGCKRKWYGFKSADDRVSPVAAYVYTRLKQAEERMPAGISTVALTPKDVKIVSPYFNIIDAWNFISDEVRTLIAFIESDLDNYEEIGYYIRAKAWSAFAKQNQFGI